MSIDRKIPEEFQNFVAADEQVPPDRLSVKILTRVREDLNPAIWYVFTKLAAVHTIVGALTLAVCPQFGIGWLSGMGLMGILMKYGHTVCSLGCGSFFVGAGALIASLVLKPEEVRVARRTRFAQISLLGAISLVAFSLLGADMVSTLALAWFLGSLAGGLATLELGWFLRRRLRVAVAA